MIDVLGQVVALGDRIAIIDRSGNGAKYVFGDLVEFDESTGMFQVKYSDGKISKWRQQFFYGIRESGFNKVLLVEKGS